MLILILFDMAQWIFSVCAVVLFTSIIGFIAPQNKMGTVVKSVFSIISALVIIKPIIGINEFDITSIFETDDVMLQTEYLDYVNFNKNEQLELALRNGLSEIGYDGVVVDIDYLSSAGEYTITKVKVNLEKIVIKSDKENININDEITKYVVKFLNISSDKEVILFE